ncbi:inner membrane protein YiaA [Pseudoalteromonas luteoviolacea]|uniref:YiaAB two helix domain-containing protein n=1 Tax=Pseudoalteromonas luteoviolacea DSM 6061 TaxID=1365250 RepID=A0A161XUK3_9GAMM|nr:inner membrane protein YiaA [Pseudoalteromonas luteoviolacea]KZN34624.1 hypothetical protein N475_18960 [Pseudoalteromonas luteoviolacea DSM 6061]MBE0389613.1 hypothetical protein [Pseudoalteromonas luteoviolacea DSM 6061]
MEQPIKSLNTPSKAFNIASVAVLIIGIATYTFGLFNADMLLNEKGYYFIVLLYGLFSAVSLQKSIRDKQENIPTSKIYHLLSMVSTGVAVVLLGVGLFNANLLLSEKGFYGIAYVMSLYAAVAVQKNIRDNEAMKQQAPQATSDTQDDVVDSE